MIKVTCALLIKNGKILITRNGESSDHAFQWEFPGGKTKTLETDRECIVREIKEELELKINVIEALVPVEHDYGIKKIKLIPFICTIKSGNLKLNNHIEEKWITINELNRMNFSEADKLLIKIKLNRQALEKYLRK